MATNALMGLAGLGAIALAAAAFAQGTGPATPPPSSPPPPMPMGTYQPQKMTVFITSKGSGDGGNLGGLAGADRICAERAAAVGAPRRTWRAYLSTTAEGAQKGVDARNRIGSGPWFNARGAEVGRNPADLHRPGSPINKDTALDEHGAFVKGRGDTPNRHDILTGTTAEGRVAEGLTCANWTSNSAAKARVGHFDRTGGGAAPNSWVSAHDSRSCSQPDLQATGGDGLFLCFATR